MTALSTSSYLSLKTLSDYTDRGGIEYANNDPLEHHQTPPTNPYLRAIGPNKHPTLLLLPKTNSTSY